MLRTTALLALASTATIVAGAAQTEEIKDIAGCDSQLKRGMALANDNDSKCAALVQFSRCIGGFEKSTSHEAELTDLTATLGCQGSDFSKPLQSKVKSSSHGLEFQVDDKNDFLFHRHRRETISVFDLSSRVSSMEKKIDNAVSTIKEENKATRASIEVSRAELQNQTEADLKAAVASVIEPVKQLRAEFDKKMNTTTENLNNILRDPLFSCSNDVKDAYNSETDVDCGGKCPGCKLGKGCAAQTDCQSGLICQDKKCAPVPTCSGMYDAGQRTSGNYDVNWGSGKKRVFCKFIEGMGGFTQADENTDTFAEWTSCGKSGKNPPSSSNCNSNWNQFPFMKDKVEISSGTQRFTAPVDGNYEWTLAGARGGQDKQQTSAVPGNGGVTKVVQKGVKAGTVFYIRVGQMGTDNYAEGSCGACRGESYRGCGGFNGGGHIISRGGTGGATGGGGTDVRMCKNGGACGTTTPGLDTRFVVAAGGGGSSSEANAGNSDHNKRFGGDGGGIVGKNGGGREMYGMGADQQRGGIPRGNHPFCDDFASQRGNKNTCVSNGGQKCDQPVCGALPLGYSKAVERQDCTSGKKGEGGKGWVNDSGGGGGGYWGGGGSGENSGGAGGSALVTGNAASGVLFQPDDVTKQCANTCADEMKARMSGASNKCDTPCTVTGANSGNGYVKLRVR